MRFLIAPNAFKGTFTALEAVSMLEEVLAQEYPAATYLSQAEQMGEMELANY